MFGPYESVIADGYRRVFVDIEAFAGEISKWCSPSTILELGCGEGAVTTQLAAQFPSASITGIDITPRVGRLFRGDRSRVFFKQQTIGDFVIEYPESCELLIVCDVMHHIPWALHEGILGDARRALKPGGMLVLKDWVPSFSAIHVFGYLAERFITGDRVRYKTASAHRESLEAVFGQGSIKSEVTIPPRANNVMFVVQAHNRMAQESRYEL